MKAIDLFAGIGGWNLALSALGIPVILVANHSAQSLDTHRLNFPQSERATLDIMTCDTSLIPDAQIMTASPECRYHSNSSGVPLRKPQQLGLWTDRAEAPFVQRSRETMNGVYRWAKAKMKQGKPIALIFVENVTDLRLWGGLQGWYANMERLGYQHHTISFNSRFARPYPVAIPQSRDRCYIVLWRRDLPTPNLDIRPAAHCPRCRKPVQAVQCWRARERRFGDYGQQYEYHCPQCDTPVVPSYTPVERVLDWNLPCPMIGERRRPLCQQTLANIEQGLRWYVRQPRRAWERQAFLLSYYGHAVFRHTSDVAGTVTTRDRHCLISLPEQWSGEGIPDVRSCGYRMCVLSEYQAMMGIAPGFRLACSKTAALKQLGLAVTPAAAARSAGARTGCARLHLEARIMRNNEHGWLLFPHNESTAMHTPKRHEYRQVPDVAQALVQPRKPAQRTAMPKSLHGHSRRIGSCAALLADVSRPNPDCDLARITPVVCLVPKEALA